MLLPFPASQYDSLARLLEGSAIHYALIGAILIEAMSWLLLLPGCFRSRLLEMRVIGAAVLFLTFVEGNRQAHNFGLPNFAQDFQWGDMDFDLRPVAYLIFAAVMLVAMTFRLRRIQSRNREVEQEMAAAQTVQQILIPDYLPSVPGLTIESAYLPAEQVGGDFFQVLPLGRQWSEKGFPPMLPDGRTDSFPAFIVIGDVSGKGLKAAMTVALIVGTLRTYAEFTLSPAELLAGLNRRLHGRGDSFATCLVLRITPSGEVTFANAGHPNPYLDGAEIAGEGNLPLGITLDVHYTETAFELQPDQLLTLLTDGVVEAKNALSQEIFGFERTLAISNHSAAQIAEAAKAFGVGAPQSDDVTVLTITRSSGVSA
jgi:serine phosphatase RsbU (regulator of sigma subunit)